MNYEKKPINAVKRPMNNDYLELENSDGMPGLVDSTVAMEFLMSVKTGIRNCAMALTEVVNLEARTELRNQLDEAVNLHAGLTQLMMDKGWLHPYDVNQQFQVDNISAKTALQIANLNLFPGDTSRLGTFTTPNY